MENGRDARIENGEQTEMSEDTHAETKSFEPAAIETTQLRNSEHSEHIESSDTASDAGQLETLIASPANSSPVASYIKEMLSDIVRFAAAATIVMTFVVQPMRVEGTSMLPRLHTGERILVNKFLYSLDGWPSKNLSIGRSVQRGDIVVFYYPKDPSARYVKRVIGLPGDTVSIDDRGYVFVNGRKIDEPYLSPQFTRAPTPMSPVIVDDHYYFVMGDNRDDSSDSRMWGLVPERYICGEACFRFWPLNEIGRLW